MPQRSDVDLNCPDCGAIAWDGEGASVDGAGTTDVAVESDDWQPGRRWRCRQCNHVVANPSAKQQALDDAVRAWLQAQHV
jgi:rubredoxin